MGHFLHIEAAATKTNDMESVFFTDSNVPKRDTPQFYEYVISKVSS